MMLCQEIEFNLKHFQAESVVRPLHHPLQPGEIFSSPGSTFKYRVIGACCRLYDRSQLPYPCCRLSWEGKEPFWNRVGRRFVPDMGAKDSPSYCVELMDYPDSVPFVITLYWLKLTLEQQRWWYSKLKRITLAAPKATSSTKAA